MEHAQRVDVKKNPKTGKLGVLILILMEHAQREVNIQVMMMKMGLNPYFNGTCSKSWSPDFKSIDEIWVLILILMEHAQRAIKGFRLNHETSTMVLILILMEHAQRDSSSHTRCLKESLNPYFNGTCSKRVQGLSNI